MIDLSLPKTRVMLRCVLAMLVLAWTSLVAWAHPHAFIVMRSEIITNADGQITAIGQEWQFDDGYTAIALEGLDANGDGAYGEEEIRPLTNENIKSLKEFDYFTVVRQNGQKLAVGEVNVAKQVHVNGLLRLSFEVPLVTPVDPAKGEVQVKIYDPEFFIAYDYAEIDPVKVRGSLAAGCASELKPVPTDAELDQTREFLADKGPDWKPETQEDFGAAFARPLIVSCAVTPAAAAAGTNADQSGSGTIDRSKLLVQQRGAGDIIPFSESPVMWMQQKQRSFYSSMSAALRGMQTSFSAVWTLLGLSFLYGVFHAAGPGHGKAVVSSWLIATENDLKRGVTIAFLSALIQALTAIVLVSALFLLVASAGAVARDVSGYLESASYAMIAALGLYLIWTTFRPHGFRPQGHAHALAPHHNHHAHGHDHHGHQHDHDHAHCGHAHAADPQDLLGEWSLSKAFSLAFAVGIRPCTGAILVLVFANSVGLYWAGIASTLVMGFGVFLTVALIAALTVYARQTALRMASGNSRLFGHLVTGARLAGGLAIALIGTTLFFASLGTTPGMV